MKALKLKDFTQAADENVNEELRYGLWRVYDHYEIMRNNSDDPYVEAPLAPGKIPKIEREYNPLDTKGLFLEFAGLAEHGDVTQESWLDWTQRFGVLGVEWMKGVELCRGGPREQYSVFNGEAKIANHVLRLYEAATGEDGPDVPTIKRLLEPEDLGDASLEEIMGWTLSEVAWIVQTRLASECFPKLYRRQDLTFVQSPSGFGSLVGAMYLQMMWLMTATGKAKRCKGPECDKIIYFDSDELPADPGQQENGVRGIYKSRKYCSTNCRVKRWQHNQRKDKRHKH